DPVEPERAAGCRLHQSADSGVHPDRVRARCLRVRLRREDGGDLVRHEPGARREQELTRSPSLQLTMPENIMPAVARSVAAGFRRSWRGGVAALMVALPIGALSAQRSGASGAARQRERIT